MHTLSPLKTGLQQKIYERTLGVSGRTMISSCTGAKNTRPSTKVPDRHKQLSTPITARAHTASPRKPFLALPALAVAEERSERHVALALVAQVARDRVGLEGARELARGRVDVADVDLHGGVIVRGD